MTTLLGFFTSSLREIFEVREKNGVVLENLSLVNSDTVAHRIYLYMDNREKYQEQALVPIMKPGLSLAAGESLRDTDKYALTFGCRLFGKIEVEAPGLVSFAIFGS